jgi:hypothetical protein
MSDAVKTPCSANPRVAASISLLLVASVGTDAMLLQAWQRDEPPRFVEPHEGVAVD